jgi:iron-sulfur cluster assembly protein
MFKISKAAVAELKRSMEHHDFDDMPLRIAAQRTEDGSIEYQMGFDEAGPGDTMIACRTIDVVIAKDHKALLNGTELDYVVLEDGEKNFIFLNPNDPSYVAPDAAENDGTEHIFEGQ